MQDQGKGYPFVVVARVTDSGKFKEIEVQVFDPDESDAVPLPIAEGSAPGYGTDDGLATAVYRAFAQLEIPPKEPTRKEIDDLIKEMEESAANG